MMASPYQYKYEKYLCKYKQLLESINTFSLLTFNIGVYHEMTKKYKPFDKLHELSIDDLKTVQKQLNNFLNNKGNPPDIVCTQEDLLGEKDIIGLPGYIAIATCQANKSAWALDATTYLANKIWAHDNFHGCVSCVSGINKEVKETKETIPTTCEKNVYIESKCTVSRCVAIADILIGRKNIRVANVHLCGGRFDDAFFKDLVTEKIDEIKNVIVHKPDIITGDFNAYKDTPTAMTYLSKYDLFEKLTESDKKVFLAWTTNIHDYLKEQGYVAIDTTRLGDTTLYGGIVDWIYVRKDAKLEVMKVNKLIAMTGDKPPYTAIISDHNALFVKFRIKE